MSMPNDEKQILTAFTIDFETGGLDCQECACTQIAMHAIRLDTFKRIDRLVMYIYPYKKQSDKGAQKRRVLKNKLDVEEENMKYESVALTYSAITMELLHSMGKDISEVAASVIEFIKKNTFSKSRNFKPFLIGQNIQFDIGFLQQLLIYGNQWNEFSKIMRGTNDFFGNFQPYYQDTIIAGQLAMCHLDNMNSYKLEVMAEKLGIELDDAHDADADVTATTNVLAVLTQRMRNANGNSDNGDNLTMNKSEKTRTHFKI